MLNPMAKRKKERLMSLLDPDDVYELEFLGHNT
jgi:hypothetical protein